MFSRRCFMASSVPLVSFVVMGCSYRFDSLAGCSAGCKRCCSVLLSSIHSFWLPDACARACASKMGVSLRAVLRGEMPP